MQTIALKLGDWSNDGHGMTETTVISSNLGEYEIGLAFSKGINQIPELIERSHPLCLNICRNYGQNTISSEIYNKLVELKILEGRTFGADMYYAEDDHDGYALEIGYDEPVFYVGKEDYANIWLSIAKLGNPAFEYKVIHMPTINIGGYGLFFN